MRSLCTAWCTLHRPSPSVAAALPPPLSPPPSVHAILPSILPSFLPSFHCPSIHPFIHSSIHPSMTFAHVSTSVLCPTPTPTPMPMPMPIHAHAHADPHTHTHTHAHAHAHSHSLGLILTMSPMFLGVTPCSPHAVRRACPRADVDRMPRGAGNPISCAIRVFRLSTLTCSSRRASGTAHDLQALLLCLLF